MSRKNTAEAFEILLEIAEEARRKREAAGPAGAEAPPRPPDPGPGARLHIVERAAGSTRPEPPPAMPSTGAGASGAGWVGPAARLRRDPLLRAPAPAFGDARRAALVAPVPTPAAPPAPPAEEAPPARAIPTPTSQPVRPTNQPVRPTSQPVREPPPAGAPSPQTAPPARHRTALGRWLSRDSSREDARAPAAAPAARGGFHARVASLWDAGAGASPADAPALADGFLSIEERRALSGGPGRKPSIDPEILRSLEQRSSADAGGDGAAGAAARAAAPQEIRLLEPREPPPSRLDLWGETPGRRPGSGSSSAKAPGAGKAASGPARRSRSRRGAASRSAPREDPPAPPDAPGAGGSGPAGDDPPREPAGAAEPGPAGTPPPAAEIETAADPAVLEQPVEPIAGPGAQDVPDPFAAPPLAAPEPAGAPPEAAPPPLPARGLARVLAGLRRPGSPRAGRGSFLDREVELRVSTIAAVALAGSILLVLVLTWLRLPPAEDAMLASFLPPEPSPAKSAGVPAADSLRSLPLWSPSSAPPGEPIAPVPAAGRPEIQNVQVVPAADAGSGLEPEPAGPGAGDAGPPAPPRTVYMIQVRGKESMEGARRILDYLALFGFEKPKIEPDPRGARNAEEKALYTVFVTEHEDRAEADRELERLKRVTRERPFRNRPDFSDFFEDAFVITRTPR